MKRDEFFPSKGIRNLEGRLGYLSSPHFKESSISGVSQMAARIQSMGGRTQQERMIRDKRRSLDKAVLYSYQGAFVKKDSLTDSPAVRALINPDKVKQDYDDKIISIGFEHEFQPGDVFEWVNTNSHWIIYLQDKTELAYFRGEIRRCRYTISFKDSEGNIQTTYAAIRGPVETNINYIQKNGISVDRPNFSVSLLIPSNKNTLDYFKRYSEFYLKEDDVKTCWRVEGVDWISMPGIIQINAVEYYSNKFEDDIENGVVGGLILEKENPNSERVESYIKGETFIKPKGTYTYTYVGLNEGKWFLDAGLPIKYKKIDNRTIELSWTASYSGQFDIKCGSITKTVVVESLF